MATGLVSFENAQNVKNNKASATQNPLIHNPKLAQQKLFADDREFHIMTVIWDLGLGLI